MHRGLHPLWYPVSFTHWDINFLIPMTCLQGTEWMPRNSALWGTGGPRRHTGVFNYPGPAKDRSLGCPYSSLWYSANLSGRIWVSGHCVSVCIHPESFQQFHLQPFLYLFLSLLYPLQSTFTPQNLAAIFGSPLHPSPVPVLSAPTLSHSSTKIPTVPHPSAHWVSCSCFSCMCFW